MEDNTPTVTAEEYSQAVNARMGWCLQCQSFTREETEGDAEGYNCPECCRDVVVGAENGLIAAWFDIGE